MDAAPVLGYLVVGALGGGNVAGALENKTILVAEDSWHVAVSLQAFLESEGAIVFGPVPSVQKALRLIEHEAIDAAVVDINLGGVPSLDLLQNLDDRHIRTVAMTGYTEMAERVATRFEKVSVLAKPSRPKELIKALV